MICGIGMAFIIVAGEIKFNILERLIIIIVNPSHTCALHAYNILNVHVHGRDRIEKILNI